MTTKTTNELLFQQGVAVLKAGNRLHAKTLLSQVLQNDPQHQPTLLWLAGAVDTPEERRQYLERAIAINPHNEAGKRAQIGLERLNAVELPAIEKIGAFRQSSPRLPAKKRTSSTNGFRPRWADDMLRISVGCFAALGMFAGFLPQLLTGTLGLFFLAVGCGAGLLHVIRAIRFGHTLMRGIIEVILFNALAFGLIYGCFWYLTVYLASQPLVVFPKVSPRHIPK